MNNIKIKQATEGDIPILESILLDTVNWLNEMGQPLWSADDIKWDTLSKKHQIDDFYIACANDIPSGCMALIDHDPFFWPNVKKGESVIMHKLAVIRAARKSGVAAALMDFFKKQGVERGVKTLRLDVHNCRTKLRDFYERHGFEYVSTIEFPGNPNRDTALYMHSLPNTVLAQNKSF